MGYPGAAAPGVGMATLAAERAEVDGDVTTKNNPVDRAQAEDVPAGADVVVLDVPAGAEDLDADVSGATGDMAAAVVDAADELAAAVLDPAGEEAIGLRDAVRDETDPAAAAEPATRELVIDDLLDDAHTDSVPVAVAMSVAVVPAAAAVPLVTEPVTAGFVDAPLRSQVRAARRLQARKVGRLVRHIELYSLLKVALFFYTCMLIVGVIAGVLLWAMLQKSGAVNSIEGFVGQIFLLENFHLEGRQIFRIGVLGGMVGVLVLTLLTVVGGLLFNLISDLTGGIRVSVVELESARPVPTRRRRR